MSGKSDLIILDEMATDEKEIYSFPLSSNFKYARTGKNGWGELHIAVSNSIISNLDNYVGALYLAEKTEFFSRKGEK